MQQQSSVWEAPNVAAVGWLGCNKQNKKSNILIAPQRHSVYTFQINVKYEYCPYNLEKAFLHQENASNKSIQCLSNVLKWLSIGLFWLFFPAAETINWFSNVQRILYIKNTQTILQRPCAIRRTDSQHMLTDKICPLFRVCMICMCLLHYTTVPE